MVPARRSLSDMIEVQESIEMLGQDYKHVQQKIRQIRLRGNRNLRSAKTLTLKMANMGPRRLQTHTHMLPAVNELKSQKLADLKSCPDLRNMSLENDQSEQRSPICSGQDLATF